jgi:GTP:adenosylcobinamide-phosphate guanylyltransferase
LKAVITAGGPIDGEYARAAGTPLKALAKVRGQTMLERTIAALRGIGLDRIAVVGNDAIREACGASVERVIPDGGSGSRNVLGALAAWEEDGDALLYLTCDMPYVTSASLRDFVERTPSDALAMPLCEYASFAARFPGATGFGITLGGERVVNGGAFHIPAGASPRIRSFATQLFEARKAPWRMATIAGPLLLLRMVVGRLTIVQLEARGRTLLGIPAGAIRNALPELSFDADTTEDYRYACSHD